MCLLVALSRIVPDAPLVIAANRDEYLTRPAVAMTVLDASEPTILGGRDELAGGTWLAVNEAGVVAGLTNRPAAEGRDPAKRSRGELPIALARSPTAAAAVAELTATVRPRDYNPAWLLVGDRAQLFFVDVTGDDHVLVEELPPGVHVLENRGLHETSPKSERVRALVQPLVGAHGEQLVTGLADVLRDHHRPPTDGRDPSRRAETLAACVHSEEHDYGTRSAAIIAVGLDPALAPDVRYADGPLCRAGLHDARALWSASRRNVVSDA